MTPVGAGTTMEQAAQPVLLTRSPRNVWLIASLRLALENWAYLDNRPTVSQEPFERLLSRIKQLRKSDPTAVIIVSLHWGGEHTLKPVPSQRIDAHRLIDAGADLLVCHHTHTLQTVEDYRGRKIYYSIGNFIFDQSKPINTRACAVKITVDKNNLNTETLPVEIKRCVPKVAM
jgi:poly-gamma-glutamate synthesis protein (capsule biosynthesis protein)